MDRRVLLVEGKNDEHVMRHLCRARGISENDFEIHQPAGPQEYSDAGVERLLNQVPLIIKGGVDRLAVIVDADENLVRRWAQLRDRLRHAGFSPIPEMPNAEGTVMNLDLPTRVVRLGVWIMPNNSISGMLEDFLIWLVREDDKTLPHVDRFLAGIPAADRPFSAQHLSKARIHSYLAVQKEPGKPLGTAVGVRYLDPDRHEIVDVLVRWLRSVFFDSI